MLKTMAAVAVGAAVLAATPGDAFRSARQAWVMSAYPPYIERETALAGMDHRGAHLAGVSVTFEDVQLVDAIPAERRLGLAYTTGIADP